MLLCTLGGVHKRNMDVTVAYHWGLEQAVISHLNTHILFQFLCMVPSPVSPAHCWRLLPFSTYQLGQTPEELLSPPHQIHTA